MNGSVYFTMVSTMCESLYVVNTDCCQERREKRVGPSTVSYHVCGFYSTINCRVSIGKGTGR